MIPSQALNIVEEYRSILADQADLTLSIPKRWEDVAIIHTNSDVDWTSNEYQDTLLFELCEKTAYTKNKSMGTVRGLYIYTNEAFSDRFGETDPAEMVGTQSYIIATDTQHVYLLIEPTDVQYLEDDPRSQKQYEQLQRESQFVIEGFLKNDDLAVNEKCPDANCYQVISTQCQKPAVIFLNEDMTEIKKEANWYSLDAPTILAVAFDGTPDKISIYFTPSGTETSDQCVLLEETTAIEDVLSGVIKLELNLDDNLMGHLMVVAEYENEVLYSDYYNVHYEK